MKFLTTILSLITTISLCQNLIKNGDFEQGSPMKSLADNLDSVQNWHGYATPDYYSVESPYPANVFNNYFGFQIPHSGKNYCGFFSGRLGAPKLYELIYSEITLPFIKDSTYYLNFYVSLGDYMTHRANSIGVLFSEDLFFETKNFGGMGIGFIDKKPIKPILIIDSTILGNDMDWNLVTLTYKARGGERYLFIGGFDNQKESNTHLRTRRFTPPNEAYFGTSYYFIDDVTLESKDVIQDTKPNFLFDFQKIDFQRNSSELTENSILILEPLIHFLKINKYSEIKITGFTDWTGTKSYNKELSLKRAKSVKKYMVDRGIIEVSIKTFGENYKNIDSTRRVEIEIKN